MRILVLGATGGTGREIVRLAVAAGYSVVALVRSRAKAQDLAGAEIIVGDALDEQALSRALDGCDGVISALGTRMRWLGQVTLLSDSTRALVTAMQARQVRRLVCITGVGAGNSRGHGGRLFDWLLLPLLLRRVYDDKDRQEAIVRTSSLDWTLIRPGILNNEPAKGYVQALVELSGIHGGTISRADVARFVVAHLESEEWLHQAPLIRW